jgi:hypothetical protein
MMQYAHSGTTFIYSVNLYLLLGLNVGCIVNGTSNLSALCQR